MTQLNPPSSVEPSTVENVSRGLLFSLGAIVVAIVGYIILSGIIGIYGYITGLVAIAIPLVGVWLYTKGAGAPPKAGRMPWIGIMIAAVIVGALTVLVASGWYTFSRFGKSGIFSSAFWTTVGRSAGEIDVILPVIITVAAGGFGIYAALRKKPVAGAVQAPGYAAPPVAAPPPAAPSPGVVLNGEPVDPNAPKA